MYGDFVPKFVKQFGNAGPVMKEAVQEYVRAVGDGTFPEEQHTFAIDDDIIEKLY